MAIRTLAGIARNCTEYPHAQVAAAIALLDRGYGKPQGDADGRESINITIRKILEGSVTVVEATTPTREPLVIEHDEQSRD